MNSFQTYLEDMDNPKEMENYLENQSLNCYARSFERRTSDVPDVLGKYHSSLDSYGIFNSVEEMNEKRKQLMALELLEAEKATNLPFLFSFSPCDENSIDNERQ